MLIPLEISFDFFAHQVQCNIDILLISETKLDESFPPGQFLLDSYNVPFPSDRDGNGGGILLFIRQDITSKLLPVNNDIEDFFVEINLRNKALISNHLTELSKNIDLYLTKYDQLLFLGNLNAGVEDYQLRVFALVLTLRV